MGYVKHIFFAIVLAALMLSAGGCVGYDSFDGRPNQPADRDAGGEVDTSADTGETAKAMEDKNGGERPR